MNSNIKAVENIYTTMNPEEKVIRELKSLGIRGSLPPPPVPPHTFRPKPSIRTKPTVFRSASSVSTSKPMQKPYYCSLVERASGKNEVPLSHQTWMKRFIEIRDDKLHMFPSENERVDQGVYVTLKETCVYKQDRHVWLELNDEDKRIFRLPSEELAWRLYMALTRFCQVPPFAEGFCKKLSGGKGSYEERMLRVTSEGILEWLKLGNSSV